MFAKTKTSDMAITIAYLDWYDVEIGVEGVVTKGYQTRDDFMPDEAEVYQLIVGYTDITSWLDHFPGLKEAAEEALIEEAKAS